MRSTALLLCALLADPATAAPLVRYNNLRVECANGAEFTGTLISDQPIDHALLCASAAPVGECAFLRYVDGPVWGACGQDAKDKLLNRIDGLNVWCETTQDGIACEETTND